MRDYIKLIIGAFLVLSSAAGAFAALNGTAKQAAQSIVDNAVDTTGVIEKRTKHTVAARKGRLAAGGIYYTMTYGFTTLDGKKYSNEINVSKEDAYAVNDGQKIAVRYNKKQPTINAATGFKDYFSQEDVENLPYGTILVSAVLMLLGGLWLCWSGGRNIMPSGGQFSLGSGGSSHALPQSRLNSVNRSGGAQTFGQR